MDKPSIELVRKRLLLELEDISILINETRRAGSGASIHDVNMLCAYLDNYICLYNRDGQSWSKIKIITIAEHIITYKHRLRLLLAGIDSTTAKRRAETEGKPRFTYRELEDLNRF